MNVIYYCYVHKVTCNWHTQLLIVKVLNTKLKAFVGDVIIVLIVDCEVVK